MNGKRRRLTKLLRLMIRSLLAKLKRKEDVVKAARRFLFIFAPQHAPRSAYSAATSCTNMHETALIHATYSRKRLQAFKIE